MLRGSKAAIREAAKVLTLAAVLIVLMLWLSGAFIYKVQADTHAAPEKAPPVAPKSQTVAMREDPRPRNSEFRALSDTCVLSIDPNLDEFLHGTGRQSTNGQPPEYEVEAEACPS